MTGILYGVTLATALGCGLVAGVFFAFSSFVMPALRRLPPAGGIAAMQSINELAVTAAFMIALFGTAVACIGLVVWAALSLDEGYAAWLLTGGALYLVGSIGVTIAGNVPLNNRLTAFDSEDPGMAGPWGEWVTRWTAWNHVRTAASLAAAAVLTIALQV